MTPEDADFLQKPVLEAVAPPRGLLQPLLPFQREGYGWMLAQEKSE